MSQTVKFSCQRISDVCHKDEAVRQSLEEGITLLEKLIREVERTLDKKASLTLRQDDTIKHLSECLQSVDTSEGHQRVADHLKSQPYPHYEAASGFQNLLIRIEADGKRTLGRFINRSIWQQHT